MNSTSICIASILIYSVFAAETTAENNSDHMAVFDKALKDLNKPDRKDPVSIGPLIGSDEVSLRTSSPVNVQVKTSEIENKTNVHFDTGIPVKTGETTDGEVQSRRSPSSNATVNLVKDKTKSKRGANPEAAVHPSNAPHKANGATDPEIKSSSPILGGVAVVEKPSDAPEVNLEALVADAAGEAEQAGEPARTNRARNKPEDKEEVKKIFRQISSSCSSSFRSSYSSSVSSPSFSSSSSSTSSVTSCSSSVSSASLRSSTEKTQNSIVVPSSNDQSKASAEPAKLNTPPTRNGATTITLSITFILGFLPLLLLL